MDAQPALQAFAPIDAGGSVGLLASVTISSSTSASAVTALPGTSLPNSAANPEANAQQAIQFYKQIQIANQTTAWAFINIGTSAIAAATVAAGYPVAPGSVVVITVNGLANFASTILAAGGTTGNITFTRGQGI